VCEIRDRCPIWGRWWPSLAPDPGDPGVRLPGDRPETANPTVGTAGLGVPVSPPEVWHEVSWYDEVSWHDKEPRLAAGRVRGSPPLARLGLLISFVWSASHPIMPCRVIFVFREKKVLILLRRPVGMIQTPPLSHPPGGLLDENPRALRRRGGLDSPGNTKVILLKKRIPVTHPFGLPTAVRAPIHDIVADLRKLFINNDL